MFCFVYNKHVGFYFFCLRFVYDIYLLFSYRLSNRSLEITRTNGDKLNNGFSGEATNLLRSLINNRQIGITAIDAGRISPQIRFYRDTQGTTIERRMPDCPVIENRNNLSCIDNKVNTFTIFFSFFLSSNTM